MNDVTLSVCIFLQILTGAGNSNLEWYVKKSVVSVTLYLQIAATILSDFDLSFHIIIWSIYMCIYINGLGGGIKFGISILKINLTIPSKKREKKKVKPNYIG